MASESAGFQLIGKGLVMKVDTSIKLEQVILSEENKAKLGTFLTEVENRENLIKYGLKPINRLMFYGDSGCGKTFLGKALSNHLGYDMLYVDIANAIASDDVAKNISIIFTLANDGGHIIFLDEVDGIAWSRDSVNAEGGDNRRALNGLFQQLDQLNPNNVVIAATNMLHRLDPAFKRRFDLEMHFLRPEQNLKDTLLKFINREHFKVIDNVGKSMETIVSRRSHLSYYALQILAERQMKRAVLDKTMTIETAKLFEDIAVHENINIEFESTR